MDSVFQVSEHIICLRVAASPDFSYNSFIIQDDEPVLIHTGRKKFFERTLSLAQSVTDVARLRHIAFSHFEADECGALNDWLAVAREAVPLVPAIGRASIEDFSLTPPRCVHEGEEIRTGKHVLRVLETPHCPHGWDACLFYETSTRTLFSSDLGAQPGLGVPITEMDVHQDIVSFQRKFGFLSEGADFLSSLERVLHLDIEILATQHGSLIQGPAVRRALEGLKANALNSEAARADRIVVSCDDF